MTDVVDDHDPLDDPPDAELTPAMRALSARRRRFVRAMLAQVGPKFDATKAAGDAGYGGESKAALRVHAHTLRHDPKILVALHEGMLQKIELYNLSAIETLHEICADPHARHQDRVKAAGMLLDRGGIPAQTFHHISVTREPTRQESLRAILEAAQRLVAAGVIADLRSAMGTMLDEIDPLEMIPLTPPKAAEIHVNPRHPHLIDGSELGVPESVTDA